MSKQALKSREARIAAASRNLLTRGSVAELAAALGISDRQAARYRAEALERMKAETAELADSEAMIQAARVDALFGVGLAAAEKTKSANALPALLETAARLAEIAARIRSGSRAEAITESGSAIDRLRRLIER